MTESDAKTPLLNSTSTHTSTNYNLVKFSCLFVSPILGLKLRITSSDMEQLQEALDRETPDLNQSFQMSLTLETASYLPEFGELMQHEADINGAQTQNVDGDDKSYDGDDEESIAITRSPSPY